MSVRKIDGTDFTAADFEIYKKMSEPWFDISIPEVPLAEIDEELKAAGMERVTTFSSPLSSYTVTRDGREFPCRLRAGLMAGDTAETNFGTVTMVRTLLTDAGWAA